MTCDGGTCYQGCTCHEAQWAQKLAAAEARAAKAEEALRDVQWCQYSLNEDGDYEGLCPQCDQTQENGHAPDCRIGMLLAPPPSAAPERKVSE